MNESLKYHRLSFLLFCLLLPDWNILAINLATALTWCRIIGSFRSLSSHVITNKISNLLKLGSDYIKIIRTMQMIWRLHSLAHRLLVQG